MIKIFKRHLTHKILHLLRNSIQFSQYELSFLSNERSTLN